MEFLKKGKKTIAIIMTLVVVLTGMYICAQRHGDEFCMKKLPISERILPVPQRS